MRREKNNNVNFAHSTWERKHCEPSESMISRTEMMDSGKEKTSEIWNGVPDDGVYGVVKCKTHPANLICIC
jgi:hypothetical protein